MSRLSVIHVVENLDKGAVENWLVNVFLESRKQDPEIQWTFYCLLGQKGRLDDKVLEAGGKIIYAPFWLSKKLKFLLHLRKVLKQGRYDILHVHHDYLSGFYLLASIGIRFKRKLLHVHNTDKWLPIGNATIRNFLLGPFRFLGIKLTDTVVGISNDTLQQFIQGTGIRKGKTVVLYYGIDLKEFEKPSADLRTELGLPPQSKILLFVGRMNEFKNPVFVVDIINELVRTTENVYAVFVGKGGEEEKVQVKSEAFGIADHIRLLGWRNDIAQVMKGADIFVFPRIEYPKEGLGLVVVEAQAAGLPMALSNGIVEDAIIIPELATFISMNEPVSQWAGKIGAILQSSPKKGREEALSIMKSSRFSLPVATKNLLDLYR